MAVGQANCKYRLRMSSGQKSILLITLYVSESVYKHKEFGNHSSHAPKILPNPKTHVQLSHSTLLKSPRPSEVVKIRFCLGVYVPCMHQGVILRLNTVDAGAKAFRCRCESS